jgi:hypothetical protein
VFELVDQGDEIIVGLRISQPDWSGSVEVFKRFTFQHGTDKVIGMQDCHDRDDALLATGPIEG